MCSRQAPTPGQGEPAPCRTPTLATAPPREANGLLAGWLVVGGRAAAACQGRRLILAPRAALLQRHSARLTTSPVRHLNPPRCLLRIPPNSLQGDAKEGLGAAQAKAEDLAGDASKAAKDAADRLDKP